MDAHARKGRCGLAAASFASLSKKYFSTGCEVLKTLKMFLKPIDL